MLRKLDIDVAWHRFKSLLRRPTLQRRVTMAMRQAAFNGYPMRDMMRGNAHGLAVDLMTYDADFEREDFDAVLLRCQRWLDKR